jgi:hypothetical protein
MYVLRTSHNEWSAGTRVILTERIGDLSNVKLAHSINHPRGGLYRPEFEIPNDKLMECKSRTFIVPVINGKERRRKVRIAMRHLTALTTESQKLPGGYK